MVFSKATFIFYKIKYEYLSSLSLKPTQMSVYHQTLFQYVFEIKITKSQVINMVSIKKIFRFFWKHLINKKSTKLPNNILNC